MEVADVADTRTPGTEQAGEQTSSVLNVDHGSSTMVVMAGAGVTLLLGLLSFVLGMVVRNASSAPAALHVVATVTGAVAMVLGLFLQMISSTRNERIIIVTGMIAGFVGAALGLAAGGFSG
jgi:ammonia channel protein AmtB